MRGQDAKKAFGLLHEDRESIETELRSKLDWQELPEGQDCRIALYMDGDIRDREAWSRYYRWFQEHAERFHKVFSSRVKELPL
jgi:hypothetical protein